MLFLLAVTTVHASAANENSFANVQKDVQQSKITGIVKAQNGEPLPGATVQVKGTTNGTVTDIDGHFSISAAGTVTLTISYVGYESIEISASAASPVSATLKELTTDLNEIVVVGYGVQKKKVATGATVQVKGEDLQKLNTVSGMTALQGTTAGVQITKSTGQPGDGLKVNIRGLGTIGSPDPLYVVDGVVVGSIDYLSPSDIESIDVLKDASAAIYGSRAANGVVLVTTKQGKAGSRASISYDAYYGVQNMYKKAPLLNAQEYLTIINEGRLNAHFLPFDPTQLVASVNPSELQADGVTPMQVYLAGPRAADIKSGAWKGTNWLDEMTNKNAPMQSHALNITGGSDQSVYSLGLAYVSQDGILGKPVASHYDRYNVRVNSEHKLLKVKDLDVLKVGENLTYAYSEKNGIATGNIYYNDVHSALVTSPFLPMYNSDGGYQYAIPWNIYDANPIAMMVAQRGQNSNKNHNIVGNIYAELQPIKNLKWRSTFGLTMSANSYRSFSPDFALGPGNNTRTYNITSQSMSVGLGWTWSNTLSYDFSLLDAHHFSVMAGTSAERTGLGESMSGSNAGNIFNDYDHAFLDNCTKVTADGKTKLGGSPWGKGGVLSYFGRLNYDYKETYMLSAILRRDGSVNFAKGKRYGNFPSLSAGWVLTNESFMKDLPLLDFLKLRGSWGQNGNSNIANFNYLSTISFSNVNYFFGASKSGDNASTGAYPDIVPNPDVTWETSEQTDLGFDARFLKSRLSLTFDWYNKATKDWLLQAPLQAIYGTNPPYINGGDIRNRGCEIVLAWKDHVGDFNYSVQGNIAFNQNKVTRIANDEGIIHGSENVLSQGTTEMYRAQVGYPIGYFWGYKTAGIFQNESEVQSYTKDGKLIIPTAVPGDVRFVDLNNDGVIDQKDKTKIGDPNPHYTYGVTLSFDYKGFDFAVVGTGVGGNSIAKSYRSFADSPLQNYTTDILGRWHGEGTSNKLPRMYYGTHMNDQYISDLYIQKGDYFRIQNITLGYDFKKLFTSVPLSQLRFYVSIQNAYTFTKYNGMDPEVGYAPTGVSGWGDNVVRGIDLGSYPSPRTVMIGASVKF